MNSMKISDDQPLPLLEHDEFDLPLNGIDWDQTLSPLDLNLPTDADIITLLSFSSTLTSPVVLPDQPPNPLVDQFFKTLTDHPIQFTENPTVPQHECRANISLPSLLDSKAHANNIQLEETQSAPSSLRQHSSNWTPSRASCQDVRNSLSGPNRFQTNQYVFEQKRKENHSYRRKSVGKPKVNSFYITN